MCQKVDTEQTKGPFVAAFMTLVLGMFVGMYVKECVCVWGGETVHFSMGTLKIYINCDNLLLTLP